MHMYICAFTWNSDIPLLHCDCRATDITEASEALCLKLCHFTVELTSVISRYTRAYIKCKRASLRSRAHNDILLDVTAHVCIIIP